jgi:hypothetical protein
LSFKSDSNKIIGVIATTLWAMFAAYVSVYPHWHLCCCPPALSWLRLAKCELLRVVKLYALTTTAQHQSQRGQPLFGGIPHGTSLQRQMRKYEWSTNQLMAQPSVLKVVDSFPIELIFPMREGRSDQQVGGKNKNKGRWSVGIKLCWILNTVGQMVGWDWATMNEADNTFLEMLESFEQQAIMLTDYSFRCQDGLSENVKVCKKGTWNDRMTVETSFSMVTVIAKAKKVHHRVIAHIQPRLADSNCRAG